jgi:hypothetical protein
MWVGCQSGTVNADGWSIDHTSTWFLEHSSRFAMPALTFQFTSKNCSVRRVAVKILRWFPFVASSKGQYERNSLGQWLVPL